MQWIFITGEYPPAAGGVSDYTRALAEALHAQGESVTVLAPETQGPVNEESQNSGVLVKRLPGQFGFQALRILAGFLDSISPGAIVYVQYVPHAFGWKGMNLLFCRLMRAQKRHRLWIMFHEVAFPIRPNQPWKHRLLARVNRIMTRVLVDRAEQVFVSTESWNGYLKIVCGREIKTIWLPIPSSIETVAQRISSRVKERTFPLRIGHFGTFGSSITELLDDILVPLLEDSDNVEIYLIGRGGGGYLEKLVEKYKGGKSRVFATGEVPSDELRDQLSSCQLMVQPYPDGVSTRRSSVMASVQLGRAVVTHKGEFTESIWESSRGVALLKQMNANEYVGEIKSILGSSERQQALGVAASELYKKKFSLSNTVSELLNLKDRREIVVRENVTQ